VAAAANPRRDDLAAYLALGQIPGIGAARLRTLIAAFGSANGAIAAPARAIAGLPGFGVAAAAAIRSVGRPAGERILEAVARLDAGVVIPGDADYPPLLAEIGDPPAALYVWGDATLLSRPAAAIVGSRNHTAYGAAAARLIAGGVARAAVVVSGMARGLDAVAHTAALEIGGATVGVLGNGFGVVYPAANRALYARVAAAGCLVSELPPGERPRVSTFPRRNRIIAGLAGVTVVVEAAASSGALITADCALDQGRSVLAVPGPITSATSAGCNKLIQQGAKPALCAADVLEEIGLPAGAAPPATAVVLPADLDDLQRDLCARLTAQPAHVDVLVRTTGREPGVVLTALTELELRGLVRQQPGMLFEMRNAECGMRSGACRLEPHQPEP
jgi:DNA processing protein